jgi:hypothetical protein
MEPTDNTPIDQSWTVAQVLAAHPQTAHDFFHLKTDCVGCVLSRFCTLKDVAKAYEFDVNYIVTIFQQTANNSQPKD